MSAYASGSLGRGWRIAVFVLLPVILLCVMCLSIGFGATDVDLLSAIRGDAVLDRLILLHERLPRTILAALVGASLSVSGLAFQAVLRNPLADPFIIGVAGGAAVGGTVAMLLPIGAVIGAWGTPVMAFIFGLGTLALTYRLSRDRSGRMRAYEVLLIGVVFNTFASAVILILKVLVNAQKVQEMLLWLMGSLSSEIRGPWAIGVTFLITLVASIMIYRVTPALNALALGEEAAASVGVDANRVTRVVFVAGSMLVASAVSVAGLIGFVGLIVPHATRLLLGADLRRNLPAAALLGAAFLVAADLLARVLFPVFETEAPVGVFTALIGGPLFVWLLRREMGGLR